MVESAVPTDTNKPEEKTDLPKKILSYVLPYYEAHKKLLTDKRFLLLLEGILFLLIFIPVVLLLFPKNNSNTQQIVTKTVTPTPNALPIKRPKPTPAPKNQSATLIYGAWTSQTSVIRAVDLSSSTITTLASLPLSIKKVSILSPNTLLYIDQTDTNGYGQRISVYDMQQKQIITNIPADSGFGIDDYLLSPNKRYLVLWEVKLSPETYTLQGGESRVNAVDLTQPTIVNQLFDETPSVTVPIHYPRAVLDDGTVFTDKMIPNDPKSEASWSYGMTTIDFDGTNQQEVASMTNGTYGSQPMLSSDGKFLLFAGYDGNNGDGTTVKNGYRQALLTPDTVELLDTHTLKRFVLPNLPDTNIYSDVQWSDQTDNPVITILSSDFKQLGIVVYDLEKLHATQLTLPTVKNTTYGYISQLTSATTLIGLQSTGPSSLGDLGATSTNGYTQLAIIDDKGKLSYVSLEDPLVQYITILPGNYFKNQK